VIWKNKYNIVINKEVKFIFVINILIHYPSTSKQVFVFNVFYFIGTRIAVVIFL